MTGERNEKDGRGTAPSTSAPPAGPVADVWATVGTMLSVAGLTVDPADREGLLALYEAVRPGVDALYALPEVRDEAPALVFQAAPKLSPWRT